MSVAVRVIPCLDVDAGRVVKGVNFKDLRDAGDPVELAARYASQRIELVRTYRCGAICWASEAPGRVRCERLQARRYWHHQAEDAAPGIDGAGGQAGQ